MTNIRIPRGFLDDHEARGLPTPEYAPFARGYVIRSDDPDLPELVADAKYYADADGPDAAPRGLKAAAKALLKAIERGRL